MMTLKPLLMVLAASRHAAGEQASSGYCLTVPGREYLV
jgi:hypothetical protein